MTRMAGDAMKDFSMGNTSFGNDDDLVEMDDGVKIRKQDVAQYVKDNYEKNGSNSFGGDFNV